MRLRGPALVATAALLAGAAALPALAAWTAAGSGSASAAAGALAGPSGVAAAAVAPTGSAIDLTWTAAANPLGTTYVVQRDKTAAGAPGPVTLSCTASPCHDTGLAAGTTFTYDVTAALAGWSSPAATATAATTGLLLVTGSTTNGSGKTKLSGTGAVANVALAVAVCRGTVPVCTTATPGYVETVTLTPTVAGSWTSSSTASKLVAGAAYSATASQGLAVSSAYVFTA